MKSGLESLLPTLPGVQQACANPLTGTVLVIFVTDLEPQRVIAAVERMLREIASEQPPPRANGHGEHPALQTRREKGRPPAPAAEPGGESWHTIAPELALKKCGTPTSGLSRSAARERLRRHGPNALTKRRPRSDLHIFLSQFQNPPVALLGASALLSVLTGGIADALVIGAVVLANAVFGFYTERQVERTIHSLEQGPTRTAKVLRGGRVVELDNSEVVPGDLILLTRGDMIPADARLIAAEHLTIDESMLTGESVSVFKTSAPLPEKNRALGDRINMAYRGTLVTGGEGKAVVVATGSTTEIGRIEQLIGEAQAPETPMQRQLREIGSRLIGISGVACAGVFAIGLLRGLSMLEMIKTSISLAIAAIPEGLPAVATTTLARGVRRLDAQGVLVRHLDAIETLASVQTICLDKTGTLTRNQQTVTRISAGERSYEIREDRPAPLGAPDVARLLEVAVLCNEVRVSHDGGNGDALNGSSTERALVQAALDAGLDVAGLRARFPLNRIRQRTEQRNRMASLHRMPGGRCFVAVKGRPNEVLAHCNSMLKDGKVVPLTEKERDLICKQNDAMANEALRVLGFGYREVDTPAQIEDHDLIWVGLMGMQDPLRRGAESLIAQFHRAGMRTVMITGDQSATARAIGHALNLSNGAGLEMLDAVQLEELKPEVLHRIAHDVHVFSRVSPSHKLQIIRALQADGSVVAMTGDGVNDGPALKAADIGIAIGAREVARDVADMVLLNDDLAKILSAIAQGRTISDDIRKSVSYLVTTNMTEVLLSILALLLGFGQPLTAMQLLWINLVSDIFPELALALEPAESDILDRPPKKTGEPIIGTEDYIRVGLDASWITAGALATFGYGLSRYGPSPQANTLAFLTLVTGQLLHTWSARSPHHSIFDGFVIARERAKLAPNPAIPLAIGAGFALEAAAALLPIMRRVLGTTPLGWMDWCVSALGGLAPFLINETRKAAGNGKRPENQRTLRPCGNFSSEQQSAMRQRNRPSPLAHSGQR